MVHLIASRDFFTDHRASRVNAALCLATLVALSACDRAPGMGIERKCGNAFLWRDTSGVRWWGVDAIDADRIAPTADISKLCGEAK